MRLTIVTLVGGLLLTFIAGCGDPCALRETTYQVQAMEKHDCSIALVSEEYPKPFGYLFNSGPYYAPPTIVVTDKDGTVWRIHAACGEPWDWIIERQEPGKDQVWVHAATLPKTVKENR